VAIDRGTRAIVLELAHDLDRDAPLHAALGDRDGRVDDLIESSKVSRTPARPA
jgi:hypothetical protein